ncbi:hypothetical protein IFR05_012175 [Cadophora sp. M221]|nr:hypothetical protein IFR05_012175 [Cadophora sp. M221]
MVDIFLIELLISDKGIRIEDAQPVEGQAKELCQLSQCKQGIAVVDSFVKWDAIRLNRRGYWQLSSGLVRDIATLLSATAEHSVMKMCSPTHPLNFYIGIFHLRKPVKSAPKATAYVSNGTK